jgi:YYY domain-containing protein
MNESHVSRRCGLWPWLILAVVLAIGAALRLAYLNWDSFQHVHPDERFMVWVADTMAWPGDLATALDPARSTLNPYRWPPGSGEQSGTARGFAYGSTPLYLALLVANAGEAIAKWMGETTLALPAALQPLQVTGRQLTEYNYIGLVGRALVALFDVGTIALVYLIARRAYGIAPALAAATLYAVAVLPIQLSHFFTVDIPLTFFVMACVALATRWTARPAGGVMRAGWAGLIAAGAMAGLAVGSKFSAVLLFAPLTAAIWIRVHGEEAAAPVRRSLLYLVVAVCAAAVAFAVTNPFSLLEPRAFASNIIAQNSMATGVMDAPYTRQFEGTLPYLHYVRQSSQWGLGWLLGFVAWAGLGWSAYRAVRRCASSTEWIILAWAVPYLAVTGLFYAKFLRYTAPLLPFLVIMGSGLLWSLRDAMIRRWQQAGRVAWAATFTLLVVSTAAWTLAFTGVYRQEHPWLQASRWIYRNVPDGATLLTEHWDDALPLRMDELPARPPLREYKQVELPLWDDDTPEKLDRLAAELSKADYVILATNRLYAPIQRLARRYPMTSMYYRLLLGDAGALGYEKVAEFSAYPRIGKLVIRDDNAEESFTVYDHPRVMIFANTGGLSESVLRSRLARYLPLRSGAIPSKAVGHSREKIQESDPADEQLLSQPVETLPVVADFRWNELAVASPLLAAALWWLAIAVIGWAMWPLLFPLLPALGDRGYGLSRAIGWLLLGWMHWMGVNLGLWQNRTISIYAVLGLLLLAGLIAAWRQRTQIRGFMSAHRAMIGAEEAVFAGAYVVFVVLRLFNPDLWQPWNGGEKFMEMAFLNAILRSAQFPPYDPYFAGGILNYYYYGLYLVGLIIKLTGIPAEIAFNLAVPSLYALSAIGVFSIGASLGSGLGMRDRESRPPSPRTPDWTVPASLALVLTLLMGNLASLAQTLSSHARLGGWPGPGSGVASYISALAQSVVLRLGGAVAPGFDYWAPSRVIPYTINEFPFWTFLFADLHPHLVSLPFGLAVIGLSLNHVASVRSSDPDEAISAEGKPAVMKVWTNLALLSLVLGSLGAINTWDLPTYFVLVAGSLLLAGWRAKRWPGLAQGLAAAVGVGVLSIVLYLPFYRNYVVQVGRGDGWALTRYLGWIEKPSPLGDWLRIWAILLVPAIAYGVIDFVERQRVKGETEKPAARGRPRWSVIGFLVSAGIIALLMASGRPTAAIGAVPLVLGLYAALRPGVTPQRAFLAWLIAVGAAVLVGTELIYLRDFLDGGDWERMNTVFKFGVPAWVILGLAGGVAILLIWRSPALRRDGQGGALRVLIVLVVGGLVAAGLVFAPLGVPARLDDRFPGDRPPVGTLDGTAYMTVGAYQWPTPDTDVVLREEREAIRWLLEQVPGSPVLAEAPAGEYIVDGRPTGYDYYRAGGLRVASMTGLPTFVGHHQYEQRDGRQVSARTEKGKEFFQTTDIARTRDLLAELGVRYVYVGALERILFAEESLRKFDILAENGELTVVFDENPVRIYRVEQ